MDILVQFVMTVLDRMRQMLSAGTLLQRSLKFEIFYCFRQLGFDGGFVTSDYFGDVPSKFSMDNVDCDGVEQHIQDCTYTDENGENCSSSEGAAVYCISTTTYRSLTSNKN